MLYAPENVITINTGLMFKKAENLLNREFEQQSINTHWVGDITYIKTYQG
ncbi:Mobile element protein [uncultured Candidatus Thioglobus sp.]|nr:Mobile element protein [uncultured Candidatus Thioglobus sp.]SMM98906.1 Mobile element protein [uncultured Candidatus Thioglobus sp.]